MASKAARRIELRENSVFEWVQDKTIAVKHIAGKINLADIFTKEMRNGTFFNISVTLLCHVCLTFFKLPF